MSFGLRPSDHLAFLTEAHDEYRQDPLSIRKAVSCCIFANHLPEHLIAEYSTTNPTKLHGYTTINPYRAHLVIAEPALAVIRDLCDYAKHGPVLSRRSVTVAKTEQASTLELDYGAFMFGFPNHNLVEKLIVTHIDGSEGWVEAYLGQATDFWRREFATMAL